MQGDKWSLQSTSELGQQGQVSPVLGKCSDNIEVFIYIVNIIIFTFERAGCMLQGLIPRTFNPSSSIYNNTTKINWNKTKKDFKNYT